MPPNFVRLDTTLPDVARLMTAMLQARDAVERQSWWHPQEPTSDEWWADVLADPRARKRERRTDLAVKQAFYRLADEKRDTILVACSKCDWRAAFSRDDLIASHGADYAMPNLLNHLAAPGCSRLGSHWDRCGVHYVEPIEGARWLGHSMKAARVPVGQRGYGHSPSGATKTARRRTAPSRRARPPRQHSPRAGGGYSSEQRGEKPTKVTIARPQAATAGGEFAPSPYRISRFDCPNNPSRASFRGRTIQDMDQRQAARSAPGHNLACGYVRGAFRQQDASHLSPVVSVCPVSPVGTVRDWRASNSRGP